MLWSTTSGRVYHFKGEYDKSWEDFNKAPRFRFLNSAPNFLKNFVKLREGKIEGKHMTFGDNRIKPKQ